MFGFLKDKLKKAASFFSKKVDEQAEDKVIEIPTEKKSVEKIPEPILVKKEVAIKDDIPTSEHEKIIPAKVVLEDENNLFKTLEKDNIKSTTKAKSTTIDHELADTTGKDDLFNDIDKALDSISADQKKQKFKPRVYPISNDIKKKQEGSPAKIPPPFSLPKNEDSNTLPSFDDGKDYSLQSIQEKIEPEKESKPIEKKSFFQMIKEKITTKTVNEKLFNDLFWEFEITLLENNVAVEVVEKFKETLHNAIVDKPVKRSEIDSVVMKALSSTITEILIEPKIDLVREIKDKKPYIICFVGINGSGKTTTIAKVVHYLKKNNITCVIAAGDTFRAAAIQQIEEHATKLQVKLIKHSYGSDSAAVAYDAIQYANAHAIDCVLIDTAGRMHSNVNLMEELKKVIRISKPDLKVFIGEAVTGNDCIDQAKEFNKIVGIDGIILAKSDVDEKGGAAVSISYVTQKPILFIGTGQNYQDLIPFSKATVLENLGLK